MKKTVLLTNDDGFDASGLKALIEAIKPLANVIVVAPTLQKSASGHSLTLTRPLRFIEIEENFYKLDDGTPSDCVFLSINKLFKDKLPDLVVSGINIGANMGEDITYSGTAAAAMEAVLQGIPAIAISQVCMKNCADVEKLNYELAKKSIAEVVKKVLDGGFPLGSRKLLNINIPPIKPSDCKGFMVTHAGKREYGNSAEVHINPRGLEYYWIGLPKLEWQNREEITEHPSDFEAIKNNYISITPIQLDMTDYKSIKSLEEWI